MTRQAITFNIVPHSEEVVIYRNEMKTVRVSFLESHAHTHTDMCAQTLVFADCPKWFPFCLIEMRNMRASVLVNHIEIQLSFNASYVISKTIRESCTDSFAPKALEIRQTKRWLSGVEKSKHL